MSISRSMHGHGEFMNLMFVDLTILCLYSDLNAPVYTQVRGHQKFICMYIGLPVEKKNGIMCCIK